MPEQLTEEDLKNMSPEQIAELQKQNCIFCRIIEGKVASKKIFEDDRVIAILDINPANPGHTLIIPKVHYQIIPMMPDEELAHMMMVAKAMSHALIKALKVQGTHIFAANGAVAGQQAPHVMLHIIPRKEGDGLKLFDLPKNDFKPEEMVNLENALRQRIGAHMGVAPEEVVYLDEPEEEKQPLPEPKLASRYIAELAQSVRANPQLKTLLKTDPTRLMNIIKTNPQLSKMFAGMDLKEVLEKVEKELENDVDLDNLDPSKLKL